VAQGHGRCHRTDQEQHPDEHWQMNLLHSLLLPSKPGTRC
jgi:hypothetical protein